MVKQIPGGFWYQDHCLKITPQKKGSSVRYRYPGEDWTVVDADDYQVSDNRFGQCAGAHYMVEGVFSYADRHGNSHSSEEPLYAFTPPSNFVRILNPDNPWKFRHTFWDNEGVYNLAYFEYLDTGGNLRNVSISPPSNSTLGLPGSSSYDGVGFAGVLSFKITRLLRAYDSRTAVTPEQDNCGNCRLTIFKDGQLVVEEERNECPEVEQTGDKCVEDESTKIEVRTNPLGQIWVSQTAYSRDGKPLADIPSECIQLYNMIPFVPIGVSPTLGSNNNLSRILTFIGEYCSEAGCNHPAVEHLGDKCGELCPDGTCPFKCGDHICCHDTDGRAIQEIPLEDYAGEV